MLRVHFPVDTASHIAMHAFSFVHAAPKKITDACTKHMHAQMKSIWYPYLYWRQFHAKTNCCISANFKAEMPKVFNSSVHMDTADKISNWQHPDKEWLIWSWKTAQATDFKKWPRHKRDKQKPCMIWAKFAIVWQVLPVSQTADAEAREAG